MSGDSPRIVESSPWSIPSEDTTANSQLSIFWSYDQEQSGWKNGQDHVRWLLWLKELGRKMIFISPDLNFTAATKADKWIPIRPGTDSALAAAIAYVWLKSGTYDKEYVKTHGVGFDKWEEYVTGVKDGVPKTPEWAENISGVAASVIRALAKEWAAKRPNYVSAMGLPAARRIPQNGPG